MTVTIHTDSKPRRDLGQAVWRGFLGRCPNCGQGKLFHRFLKVVDHCDVCGEEFHHHRADDLPAYLAIVVVGHVVVFLMVEFEMHAALSPLQYLMILIPLSIVLAVVLLQPIKGAVVGLQWANRMHGFDKTVRDPALPDEEI
jgi:uncharacterized protein (DUF983 family)